MGLKEKSANLTYVKIKEGRFYESTDKEYQHPYDELEGTLKDIGFRDDEWEGQPIRKMVVTMTDGEQDYQLSFSFDSSYSSTLISFLKNTDLSRPFSIVPVEKEEGDKKKRSLLIKQNNNFVKAYYTKDNPHGLPSFEKQVVNRKTVWDKTKFLDFLETVVIEEIKPRLGSSSSEGLVMGTSPKSKQDYVHDAASEVVDDLPF